MRYFNECLLALCFWLLWAVHTVKVEVFHPLYVQQSPVFWCWQILPVFFFLLAFLWQAECWVWWCMRVQSQKQQSPHPHRIQGVHHPKTAGDPLYLVRFVPKCLLVKCLSLASWCLVNALLVLLIRGCRWLPLSGREYALAERNECFFRGAFHAINVACNQDTQVQCYLKL